MKLFSATQIRACDAQTIEEEGILSIDLMERAATACADYLLERFGIAAYFVVFAGMGNNGGDGLAIARLLRDKGCRVAVHLVRYSAGFSEDCAINYQRLEGAVTDIVDGQDFPAVEEKAVILDAILGTGLNRPLSGKLADIVSIINKLNNTVVSIDMPTGMQADAVGGDRENMISADVTLSFQFYKRAFLHPEVGGNAGEVVLLDIGLSNQYMEETESANYMTTAADIVAIYRPRSSFSHKGTYGTALIIGGSYGMMGAAAMATLSAARAGAGKVLAIVPKCGYEIMQTMIPVAMVRVLGTDHISAGSLPVGIHAIGIGPGMGNGEATVVALEGFLKESKVPIVVDADALNIIAKNKELLRLLPSGSILTPHPKEFERIFGKAVNSMDAVELAREMARQYGIYIVLKNRYSAILTPEGHCYYNSTGNAGMATGGSGDVLTGLLTGLLSQGYSSHEVVLLGCYLHGLAGDLAAAKHSEEAMLATDIIDHVGDAYKIISAANGII